MSTHKKIDKLCCVVLILSLIITAIFMNAKIIGIGSITKTVGYADRLFNSSVVHSVNIIMDDWDSFLDTCTNEEYTTCDVIIDSDKFKNVAIRAKGNTSLTQVDSYGNDRYSLKFEFDQYDETNTYYGLDKFCLNNIIQDNTYMKDFLTYQLMSSFGVAAPMCSFVQVYVNGEEWGLYLAVEGIEESFLERNYGTDYGELYKPDSQSMGGQRGNGKNFNLDDVTQDIDENTNQNNQQGNEANGQQSGNGRPGMPGDGQQGMPGDNQQGMPGNDQQGMQDHNNRSMGSSDVSLIYTDDEFSSYSNIINNAKTDITNSDKERLIESLKLLNENSNIEEVVDVEQVIKYFVVHNFVLNFDSYTGSMIHNYYLYEKDGKLSMIPWDYNLAFGGFLGGADATELVNYPIDTPVSGGDIESRPMLSWIFASDEYTSEYHNYFQSLINEVFDSGYFTQLIDSTKEMIAPYVQSDPTKFCTYDEFEKGIDTLKEFCLLRADSITGQLDGTIPSDSQSQSNDKSSFVDGSSISISDMGSMRNNTNMQINGKENNINNLENQMENRENQTGNDETQMGNNENQNGNNETQMGNNENQNGNNQKQPGTDQRNPNFQKDNQAQSVTENKSPKDIKNNSSITANNKGGIILGIVSIIVLLIALIIVKVYKRRS